MRQPCLGDKLNLSLLINKSILSYAISPVKKIHLGNLQSLLP